MQDIQYEPMAFKSYSEWLSGLCQVKVPISDGSIRQNFKVNPLICAIMNTGYFINTEQLLN